MEIIPLDGGITGYIATLLQQHDTVKRTRGIIPDVVATQGIVPAAHQERKLESLVTLENAP
jgi:hypothetical protein